MEYDRPTDRDSPHRHTIVVGANGGLSQVARGRRVMLLRCGRPRLVALCVGAVVGLGLCGQRLGQATRGQDTRAAPADQRSPTFASAAPFSLTGAEVAFATDLYGQLAKTSGNIVFSPSSVSAVLAMLLVGAEGDTASQLRSALHVGGFSDNEVIAAAAALRQQLAALADDPQSEVLTTDELWPQRGYAHQSRLRRGRPTRLGRRGTASITATRHRPRARSTGPCRPRPVA